LITGWILSSQISTTSYYERDKKHHSTQSVNKMVARNNKYTKYLQFPRIRKFLDEVTLMSVAAFARVRAVAFALVWAAAFSRAQAAVFAWVWTENTRGIEEDVMDEASASDPAVRRQRRSSCLGRGGFSSEVGGYDPVDEEGGAVSGEGGSDASDLGRGENWGEEWLHAGLVVDGWKFCN
jgi:hypothetical protein